MTRDVASSRGTRLVATRALSRTLLAVDVLSLILALAHVHGPARFVAGLVFVTLVPGWALVGLVKLDDAALQISLSVATSLALLIILAQAMTALDIWRPFALEVVVGLACVPSLAWQARGERRGGVRS